MDRHPIEHEAENVNMRWLPGWGLQSLFEMQNKQNPHHARENRVWSLKWGETGGLQRVSMVS
ncbi:hypothetical protein OSJ77_08965, partial [Phyllobacterium sp. 0TCS1.6C]|uniref:hypothetical protein n=1 Tax=unclassified Phyllobacterium TaxID=2638441 RepID=UPI002264BAEE